jgi:hypothetical protein
MIEEFKFAGLASDMRPRQIPTAGATDCDSVVIVKGTLRLRPSTVFLNGGGSVGPEIKSLFHACGEVDYVVALERKSAWVKKWSQDLDLREWGRAPLETAIDLRVGSMMQYNDDVYIASAEGVRVIRWWMDSIAVLEVGMEALDGTKTTLSVAKDSTAGYLPNAKTFTVWASRYNARTGAESNATEIGSATTDANSQSLKITIGDGTLPYNDAAYVGTATHFRLYVSRADGLGYPGLIAEIHVDPQQDTIIDYYLAATVLAGYGGETIGSADGIVATYSEAEDDTDVSYAPPTMHGLPPICVGMCFWRDRMFYLTEDGLIYFSQSIEDLQGHVEYVAADSYRALPEGEKAVAIKVYRDTLYVFTTERIYRLAGSVNSLTDAQVVAGTTSAEILSTDILDGLEDAVGCASNHGVVIVDSDAGSMCFYAGINGLYRFDGERATPMCKYVSDEWRSRYATSGFNNVFLAHHASLDLIVCMFRDLGAMVYNYMEDCWTQWDGYQQPGSPNPLYKLGPVCTRNTHKVRGDECIWAHGLYLESYYQNQSSVVYFDDDVYTDQGALAATIGTWTGPRISMGQQGRRKRFVYLQAFLEQESAAGSLYVSAYVDGGTRPVPMFTSPTGVDLTKQNAYGCRRRLGFYATDIKPYFYLTGTNTNVRLTGYAVEAELVGRR